MSDIKLIGFKSNRFESTDEKRTMRMHSHTSLEISYILDGELKVVYQPAAETEPKTVHLFAQQFMVIRPNCMHYTEIPDRLISLGLEFILPDKDIFDYIKSSEYVNKLPLAQKRSPNLTTF